MKRGLFLLIVLVIVMTGKVSALTVFDPANYTQNLLIATRELQSIEQRIQQLANEAQMLLNMEKNLRSLSYSLTEPVREKLTALRDALNQAKDLARSIEDQEALFNRLYSKDHTQAQKLAPTLEKAKAQWDQKLNAFKAAFGIQARVLDNVRQDSDLLTGLMQKSQSAIGTKSAIQAGNELLALNVKQLLQLQTLLATQARGTTLEQAERADNQAASQSYFKNFLGKWGQ